MGTIKPQPAIFSNINTRYGRVNASQPVFKAIKIQRLIELPWKQLHV
jgi:hypothetical protein